MTVPTTMIQNNTGNFYSGLVINSAGTVTVSNYRTSGNINGFGILIDNRYAATPKTVTVSSAWVVNENASGGLRVYSDGAITINGAYAANNSGGYGIYLENTTGTAGVTVTNAGAYHNGLTGIDINTKGAVSLTSAISCTDNGDDGLYINNMPGTGSVTVSAVSHAGYENNGDWGIRIYSNGAVTLTNIAASYNVLDCGVVCADPEAPTGWCNTQQPDLVCGQQCIQWQRLIMAYPS